ncbi:Aromatic-L-amino-acid decarboxylase [Rubellimicrobium mesophilum DSM 19309]|uniref:Aromatic-L-amino-acid decarboxylase n=1 Tax=Rubellimicrobium mesophilum DSM 19309 TaxID=442562 RepID=A0A017HFK6_9RHOB|nr:aminotransferase class V-fold PLP-dependent enzyme [Rubellimicrobium mesophilum]EYD72948.1 Aromatic-L-amino-acid decarboxylase [Rubellimicrobium mesophilum DSM 19309]
MTTGLRHEEEEALRRALSHALAYRRSLPERPIPATIDAAEATRRFSDPLPDHGRDPAEVIDDLVARGEEGLLQMASPGFHGYVIGAGHPAGIAADLLVSAWGQNAAYAATTPTTAAVENAVAAQVVDLLGLPAGGAGFVTGATMANTVGVMAARHALLAREGWDVEARGLFGAPEIHVVLSAEAHSAVHAALRYAGLGSARAIRVPADEQGRIRPEAFAEAIAPLSGPVLVVLQAGHVNSGAFDPFEEILPLARGKNAWVHVDGAFGLWLRAVPDLALRLTGVEQADSWALDLHKWLNAPYDAGLVLTREAAPLVGAMSAHGAYLPEHGAVPDPADAVPELSRRARGVPSWAILQTLGREGVREMVARHCRLAAWIGGQLSQIPGITVLNEVVANQVAFHVGEGDRRDAATAAVLARVQAGGRVYPTHGQWRGGAIIRVSVIGHRTDEDRARAAVEAIREAWAHVREEIA